MRHVGARSDDEIHMRALAVADLLEERGLLEPAGSEGAP